MAFSWFLNLSFKCLHHFAWPLVALVYPMWASVQAIETDSNAETKNLISYWILLSLIYLFEYAFMSLLQWFLLWLYIKLMIIFLLAIPDFGRASYVYNNFIRPMKLQIVEWRFNNFWRKCFVEKDDFLMHAERYVKENGTEALEKLIASKNTMCIPHVEATNDILATDDKETLKTNVERPETNIKDLEAIANHRDISVIPETVPSQNASAATVENKGTAESNRAGGEVPQSCTSTQKELQEEWNCAVCLVTTSNQMTWNSHLRGRKHMAAIKTFIAKKQPTLQKQNYAEATNEVTATESKETLKNTMCRPDAEVTNEIIAIDNKNVLKTNGERLQIEHLDIEHLEAIEKKEIPSTKQDIPIMPKVGPSHDASSATVETKGTLESDRTGGEVPPSSSTKKELQKEWTCALCLVTTTSEITLNCHFSGRKHTAAVEALIAKTQSTHSIEMLKTNGNQRLTDNKYIKDLEAIEKKEIPATKQNLCYVASQKTSSDIVETAGAAEIDSTCGDIRQSSSTLKEVQKGRSCAFVW